MKTYKSNFVQIFNFDSFESFALTEFHSGIVLKFADIAFGKYFIYLQTPQNALYPCVIYNALISHRAHIERQKPIIHFTKCKFLDALMQSKGAKAKIMKSNAFSYAVGSSERVSVKIFYDAKLPFCAECVKSYKKFFSIKDFSAENATNLWANLFANELLCAIELESLRRDNFEIFRAQDYFYLTYKRENERDLGDLHKIHKGE